ncbi:hypothetical protein B0H10DRAFT_1950080 [Mycena sp. CBHHK59/15]|nr:hypothetical protein B0H10DRAFT_1950080 [Mycena sp. CBHHK59/15]
MAVLRMWIDLVTTEATLELQGLDQNHSFSHKYTCIERLSAFGPRLTRCSLNSSSYRPESLVSTQLHLYRPFEQLYHLEVFPDSLSASDTRLTSPQLAAPSILQAIDLNRSFHYKYAYIERLNVFDCGLTWSLQLANLSPWLNLLFFDTSTLNVRAPSDVD